MLQNILKHSFTISTFILVKYIPESASKCTLSFNKHCQILISKVSNNYCTTNSVWEYPTSHVSNTGYCHSLLSASPTPEKYLCCFHYQFPTFKGLKKLFIGLLVICISSSLNYKFLIFLSQMDSQLNYPISDDGTVFHY